MKDIFDKERLQPNSISKMDVQIMFIGENKYPALIIDNYLKDPQYVRDLGLNLHYQSPTWSYTGKHAPISLPMGDLWNVLHKSYTHLFAFDHKTTQTFGRPYYRFSLIGKNEDSGWKQSPVHCDQNLLEGYICLTAEERCKGGTKFFRHKKLGIEECLNTEIVKENDTKQIAWNKVVEMGALSKYQSLIESKIIPSYDALFKQINQEPNTEFWESTQEIKLKYNRLVCFPCFLMHQIYFENAWFGKQKENMRLTLNFSIGWPSNLENI
jgi:hypothetical protein